MPELSVDLKYMFDVSNIYGFFSLPLASDSFTGSDCLGNHWQMVWCESGSREYTVNNHKITLIPGMVIFFPPHIRRQVRGLGNVCILHYMNFTCRGDAIWDIILRGIPLNRDELKILQTIMMQGETIFRWPNEICCAPMEVTKVLAPTELSWIKLQIESLMMRIHNNHPAPISLDKKPVSHRRLSDGEFFDRACKMMEEHFSYPLSSTELSDKLNISLSSLKRIFRDQCGHGITEHYNVLRMERAKLLMRTSTANISQIANQLGFSSPFYFSRVFKASTGISPTEFIKKNR